MEENWERTRYVFVLRLPRQVESRIEDAFLTLLGTTRPIMGYHITLLGAFYLAQGIDRRSLSKVADLCLRRRAFPVRIAGLDAFETRDSHAVYLRVAAPDDIVALHNDLLDLTGEQITFQDDRYREWNVEQYKPHVTLGLGLTDGELDAFLRLGAERDIDETFDASGVWLVEQVPKDPWQYVAEYPFGSDIQNESPPTEPETR